MLMVHKGSIIRVDFSAWTADNNELFDTTSREVAKSANQVNEKATYGPMPAIVGVGRLIPGFDKALLEAAVGEERTIDIPATEGFGEKDSSKIETVAMKEFQKQEVQPYPGMRVNFQGKMGTVASVSAGRVRIDYNPVFAGKTLRYQFKVLEEVADPVQRVKALIELDYGMNRSEGFGVTVDGDVATIQLPDSCKYDQRWFVAKYRLVSDLRQYAGVKTVRFVEEYVTEEAPVPDTPAVEAPHSHEHGAEAAAHQH